ncbi:hypothetical protein BK008_11095 [Methanobacterium sp. MZ-A1]|uniref:BREX system ATP-binding domain-containing protein n=1 Tax=Methanobacterium sp. MZ-A1 TaxID=1911685 RepID=UPI000C2D5308|nr:BREX system ATP-binding domain-containing protein [Methanobacterium sp. MZ-A1]AUB58799.1 hypothetical protein BK008_11095 [Methanobacterium sp. MZ-A1]
MDYEDIIMALKNGNVPSNGAAEICIGRENEIAEFQYLLKKVDEGKAITKFVNGEFGSGKSFFLKVIEEMAFEDNFVVSKVTLSRDVPFNKFEVVYKNIVKSLRCKTGISLEHIIERWITKLKMMAFEETSDPVKQNLIVNENLHNDLERARKHSNPFAVAIENYHKAMNAGDYETAKYAQAWLRGDSNIPFTEKRKFGVKGDIDRENAFKFLEALAAFLKTIGYSGLVVLIDEAEYMMMLTTKKLRDTAYNYLRDIYDECSLGNFQNTLFVFAGTPQFFEDPKLGVPSYKALSDRIEDALDTSLKDLRKPVIKLEGFTKDELIEIAGKLMIMHEEVFEWNGSDQISPVLESIVDLHEENAALTGGKVTPRMFVRSFISVLDTVQQNPDEFDTDKDILKVFEEKETEFEEEFDDDW